MLLKDLHFLKLLKIVLLKIEVNIDNLLVRYRYFKI